MAKGFAPWKPKPETLPFLGDVIEVIEAHLDDWPLTQRSWLYRLMAKKGWLKVDEYNRNKAHPKDRHLCTPGKNLNLILDRGRRAGLIPWEAVQSKRGELNTPLNKTCPAELADSIEYVIETAQFDRQKGQAHYVVLWCETEGMVPILWPTAKHYGASILAGKGFDVIGSKYDFANTIAKLKNVLILHAGDLDKSGHTVHTALVEDLSSFIEGLGGNMTMKRIALTEAQVQEYRLKHAATPAPPGLNSGNHGAGFTSKVECQFEAMESKDLRALVAAEFERALDMDLFKDRLANEKTERFAAIEILKKRFENKS
jgi:hypothetical protein